MKIQKLYFHPPCVFFLKHLQSSKKMGKNGNHRRNQHVPDGSGNQHVPDGFGNQHVPDGSGNQHVPDGSRKHMVAFLYGKDEHYMVPFIVPENLDEEGVYAEIVKQMGGRFSAVQDVNKLKCIAGGCNKLGEYYSFMYNRWFGCDCRDTAIIICCETHCRNKDVAKRLGDLFNFAHYGKDQTMCTECGSPTRHKTVSLAYGRIILCRGCRKKYCHECFVRAEEGKKFKICGGCKIAAYCGAKCQKRDWQEHKKGCDARRLQRQANK